MNSTLTLPMDQGNYLNKFVDEGIKTSKKITSNQIMNIVLLSIVGAPLVLSNGGISSNHLKLDDITIALKHNPAYTGSSNITTNTFKVGVIAEASNMENRDRHVNIDTGTRITGVFEYAGDLPRRKRTGMLEFSERKPTKYLSETEFDGSVEYAGQLPKRRRF